VTKRRLTEKEKEGLRRRNRRRRLVWVGVFLGIVLLVQVGGLPFLRDLLSGSDADQSITNSDAPLASFFEPEVLYWRDEIRQWADMYHVNPNVIAIVMQIESCGNPVAVSSAGALGLMQVMPFHFDNGENMIEPDTNVQRGMIVFYECLEQFADWDLGLALACYNGGPGVTMRDRATWPSETQSYYRWATGMWDDVVNHRDDSSTLSQWLEAGGSRLCSSAAPAQSHAAPAAD
jgi:hypothetical protein